MPSMRLATSLAVAAFSAFAPAAVAAPVAPPAEMSTNVTWLSGLDEPGAVSARFRDGRMYLSHLRGLSIYDVRDPERPVKLGGLDLPHFENEDVDVGHVAGKTIMLISNDPSEGKGALHIIDVSDPAAPKEIGTLDTGFAEAGQGILLGFFGAPNPVAGGTGHTASCVQDCRYVYLAGTAAGIDVADLSDPTKPKLVKNLPMPETTGGVATHDVQFDAEGLAWFAGYGGTAAYDITDPLNPKLRFRTNPQGASRYLNEPVNDGSSLNDYVHHNSLRLRDANGKDSDTVVITEEDYTRPGCDGAGSVQTWKIGDEGVLSNLDSWSVEPDRSRGIVFCSAHYFDVRAGLIAQGFYEQGTRFLDISNPADIRQVGYWVPRFTETWGALYPPTDKSGEIVYSLDLTRGIDVLRIDRPGASKRKPAKARRNRSMRTVKAPTRRSDVPAGLRTATFAGLCRLPRLSVR